MKKIKIVTDSVCDIAPALLEKWDIHVIPCWVNFDGESYLDDGEQFDRDHYYERLPDMTEQPSTAAPSPELAREILEEAMEGADHLIGIHVPEKLSATLTNIRLGAQGLPQERVTLVDAQTLTFGIGMQVLVAAEIAQETGDVAAVLDAVERVRQHQQLYAAFATMEYLRRSGRVSALVASVGSLLQIKPIVRVWESDVIPVTRVRTFKKAQARLRDLIADEAPLDRLAVLHIRNEEGARAFRESLGELAPPDTPIVEVGPTLGTHIGPGSVGALTLSARWRA